MKHEVKESQIKNYIAILKLNNRQIIDICDSGILISREVKPMRTVM